MKLPLWGKEEEGEQWTRENSEISHTRWKHLRRAIYAKQDRVDQCTPPTICGKMLIEDYELQKLFIVLYASTVNRFRSHIDIFTCSVIGGLIQPTCYITCRRITVNHTYNVTVSMKCCVFLNNTFELEIMMIAVHCRFGICVCVCQCVLLGDWNRSCHT